MASDELKQEKVKKITINVGGEPLTSPKRYSM